MATKFHSTTAFDLLPMRWQSRVCTCVGARCICVQEQGGQRVKRLSPAQILRDHAASRFVLGMTSSSSPTPKPRIINPKP